MECPSSYLVIICLVSLSFLSKSGWSATEDFYNVAWHKPTRQTDVYYFGESWKAVDGDMTQRFDATSCTHVQSSSDNYWIVDLLYIYPIHHINISNRVGRFSPRLQNFYIYISKTNPLPLPGQFIGDLCLHHIPILSTDGPQRVTCDDWHTANSNKSVSGRFVYVWKPRNSQLTICEFQVFVEESKIQDRRQNSLLEIVVDVKIAGNAFLSIYMGRGSVAMKCVHACLSTRMGVTASLHFNTVNGLCECFQNVYVDGESWPTSPVFGWVVFRRDFV